jgi:transcription elongation factor Elf1
MAVELQQPPRPDPECSFCGGRKTVPTVKKGAGVVQEKCPACDGLGVFRLPIVTGGPS